MPDARIAKPLVFLAACLLAGAALVPAQAQVTAGEEELLSPTGDFPAIDADGQGGFVAVWADPAATDGDVFGSLLPAGGGDPGPGFLVNNQTAGIQGSPDVAAGPGGAFMVVWQGGRFSTGPGGDGDQEGVFGQVFGRAGVRQGPQRRLSQTIVGPQIFPKVAAVEDGSFVAAWADRRTARFEVVARRFSPTGLPVGPDLPMKVGGEYNNPAGIAAYPGGFALAWEEGFSCSGGRPDGSFAAIARFDSSGRMAGRVFRMGSHQCGQGSSIAALTGSQAGVLAILGSASGYDVQRFSPSGDAVGGQLPILRRPICSGERCEFVNTAAMDDFGRFAVVWEVTDHGVRDYFVQAFNPRGRPLAGRVLISPSPGTSLGLPAIALANDGAIAVVWRREGSNLPEEDGLFVRRFRLP